MENYRLEIFFHAENQQDAEQQAINAVNQFDDGYEEAWLKNAEGRSKLVDPTREID